MPRYIYKVIDLNGKLQHGVIEVLDYDSAKQQLTEQYNAIIELKASKPFQSGQSIIRFNKKHLRLKHQALCLLSRQLAVLLDAGIILDKALDILAGQQKSASHQALFKDVSHKIKLGYSLSQALLSCDYSFPKSYCQSIAAAEHSGQLSLVLYRLAEYYEGQKKMSKRFLQAMLYPSIMLLVAMVVIIFLFIFIIPPIAEAFQDSDMVLPYMTKIMIAIADHLSHNYFIYVFVLMSCFTALYYAYRYDRVRNSMHLMLVKLPWLGSLIQSFNGSQYGYYLALLYDAGVPIVQAMQYACSIIQSQPIKSALMRASKQVEMGQPIYIALKKTGYFPHIFINLIATGEASGNLTQLLNQASRDLENDLNHKAHQFMTCLEPLMVIIMGVIILLIVLSVLLPIINMNNMVII